MNIAAIVLAAGQSKRMGRPKMTLPWQGTTVIGRVILTLQQAGLKDILVITGGARQEVEDALKDWPLRLLFNPHFAEGEMAQSLQLGLSSLDEGVAAALIVLGDQPQIEVSVVQAVIAAFWECHPLLVIPSFQRRRGHPWLAARPLWPEILALQPPATPRDFLDAHQTQIHYLSVETDSILQDLDTPQDYQSYGIFPLALLPILCYFLG